MAGLQRDVGCLGVVGLEARDEMMTEPITQWIEGARRGDNGSESAIWNQYFEQVVRLARSRMFALQGAVYDEEDAAVSALHSLFRGIRAKRFPELRDRHNLWRILVLITKRKLRAQWRRETAQKRRPSQSQMTEEFSIQEIISDEPTPDFVAEMMDETERLVAELGDAVLQKIALMRLDGLTNDEIGDRLGCASRTIRRKMERIRDIWGVDAP